jgi:hypothetical protein
MPTIATGIQGMDISWKNFNMKPIPYGANPAVAAVKLQK